MIKKEAQASSKHWNSFYQTKNVPIVPSQFAVFMLGEMPDVQSVIEFGCGNGRDSLFFSRHGCRVLGIDASAAGIEACVEQASKAGLDARFMCSDVTEPNLAHQILNQSAEFPDGKLMIYARFFIHAISEAAEAVLLNHVRTLLENRTGIFGVEFRTHRDAQQTKVTPTHFRRYVDPAQFVIRASRYNLHPFYSAEGFGMAKYLEDDAHVARFLLKPTP